jgi:polyprenyl P-hydroxybenzoate/phenylacrylic acid decarboxylase-like protein
MRVVLGITGASGVIYGIKTLEALSERNAEVHLILSDVAEKIIAHETPYKIPYLKKLASKSYDNSDLFGAPASGSVLFDGMVIAPCSMKTLASVSSGYTDNLISRAADVCLKEKRKLILVPRETPLSIVHIKNMLSAAEAGAMILPAMPAFYHKPDSVEEFVNYIVCRILDALEIENKICRRWTDVPHKRGRSDI